MAKLNTKKHGRKQVKAVKVVKKGRKKVAVKRARSVHIEIPRVAESLLLDLGDHFACKSSVSERMPKEVYQHREREALADGRQILVAMGG